MSKTPWPLDVGARPRSQSALVDAGADTLRSWLCASVLSWTAAASDEERVRSFSPLVFPPHGDPAREFASWWERASTRQRRNMEDAIADGIETIDPVAYAEGAILLLAIGAHFGCSRGLSPIYAMLAKPLRPSPAVRAHLSLALVQLAVDRATAHELRALAYRLREADLLDSYVGIDLLVRASVTHGADLLEDLMLLVPALVDETFPVDHPERGDLRRYWANALVDGAGAAKAFRFALEAQRQDQPEFREALELHRLKLAGPTPGEGGARTRWLFDKVLGSKSPVDVSDFDHNTIVEIPGSAAAAQKRLDRDTIDADLGLADFEPDNPE